MHLAELPGHPVRRDDRDVAVVSWLDPGGRNLVEVMARLDELAGTSVSTDQRPVRALVG